MTKEDIADIRRWHRMAVRRAIQAGFDLVTLYVSHGITVFTDFLSPSLNRRTDEYGGPIENRVRLLRETLHEVLDEASGNIAVGIRFGLKDGTEGYDHDGRAVIEMLAEMPDFWDVNVGDGSDMLTSRFRKEGWQESTVGFVKSLTSKPVVGVGRFTSPDTMVSMVRRGVLDLIGAARPSIADPFMPRKIEEGRIDDIRECIGCNICLASNQLTVPIRCTQNPTMSEEWRRGWHPEKIPPAGSSASVLVIGAGPAGLEAARAAGARGYAVTLAEATRELGGHLNRVTKLPGFAEWGRARDWRIGQINKMSNVSVYRESLLSAADVIEFGCDVVMVATGATWRSDGVGLTNFNPIPGFDARKTLTPDNVLAGAKIVSPVVVFDDDPYITGGAVAEMLARAGHDVTLVTPAALPSSWTQFTYDISVVQRRLVDSGIRVVTNCNLTAIKADSVEIAGVFGEAPKELEAATLIMVTMRLANDNLLVDLRSRFDSQSDFATTRVVSIGDCDMPGLLAEAIHSGHAAARALDTIIDRDQPFRIEQADIVSGPANCMKGSRS
jgi:dimethylamine/trimethylamine dehydrogenase